MNHLRVGVIGVGRMGSRHCRIYANMRKVQLEGVFDSNPATSESIARQYEVANFSSYEDLLDHVDAVSIATPTDVHFEQVMTAIDRGIHVLVEKPLAYNLEEAAEIVDALTNTKLVVQVGHIERFNPAYIELKNVLENLTPIAVNFYRLSPFKGSNLDVDVILDLMIHDTNLFYDLLQEEPTRIEAFGTSVFSRVIDHAQATICLNAGGIISLTASRVTEHKVRLIEVIAKDAYVRCDLLNKNVSIRRSTVGEYFSNSHPGVKYHQESIVEWINVPSFEPLYLQQQHFVDCVFDNTGPVVTAEDGYKAMNLAIEVQNRVLANSPVFSAA